jgi:chaperone modulatory protein CbpM
MADDEKVLSGFVLDESVTLTLDELGSACAVETAQILQLVEEGILEPIVQEQRQWCFPATSLPRIQKAMRLQRDLDINLAGVALVLDLLDELERVRARLHYLENR